MSLNFDGKAFVSRLIDHQFKVNWSYSVGAIVPDVLGPGFALHVDDDAT